MTHLHVIQSDIHARATTTTSAHPHWPCRKGCDDCCRTLASVPLVTHAEWQLIYTALTKLTSQTADYVRQRIRDSAASLRPIVCPMLDTTTGTCLVYDARPIACRSYGFYAEREKVLGCRRIETIAEQSPDVVWGNHSGIEERLRTLGSPCKLHEWLK